MPLGKFTCTRNDADEESAQLASHEPEATLGCVGVVLHVVEDAEETAARVLTCEATTPQQLSDARKAQRANLHSDEAKNDMQGNSDAKQDANEDDEELRAHIEAQLLSAKPIILRNGQTALHLAARRGLEEAVAKLLAACPSLIDRVAFKRDTALHVAAYEGHAGIVAQLLAVKPDLVNAKEEPTALQMASYRGHAAIVTQLLAANPAIDGTDGWKAVRHAAYGGHPEIVSQLLALSPTLLEVATSKGWTELHRAAHAGNAEVVAQLLAADPTLIDAKTDENWTVLHWAAHGGHVTIMTQVLAAKPALLNAMTNGRWTALHCAATMGHVEATRYLAMNSALGAPGEAALHCAAEKGHEGVVEVLLAAYPDSINATTGNVATPLHLAAENGHKGVVAQLLAVNPALIHAATWEGWSALHCAINRGHEGVVAQLLALHPESALAMSGKGWTVFHCAAYSGSQKIFSRLLAAVPQATLNKMLFRKSARDYESVKKGSTALHVAARYGSSEVAAQLLVLSPNLTIVWNSEQTCLHSLGASHESNVAVGNMLLAFKPDLIHAIDANGNTILHSMASHDTFDDSISRKLIERVWRLNPDALRAVNFAGETPFDLAVKTDNQNAINLLQWSLTFDEVTRAYSKVRKESYVARFKPLMELQCEELFAVLIPDVVGMVFNYLGL